MYVCSILWYQTTVCITTYRWRSSINSSLWNIILCRCFWKVNIWYNITHTCIIYDSTYVHTHAYTYTHACTHARTLAHTHTHTHTPVLWPLQLISGQLPLQLLGYFKNWLPLPLQSFLHVNNFHYNYFEQLQITITITSTCNSYVCTIL